MEEISEQAPAGEVAPESEETSTEEVQGIGEGSEPEDEAQEAASEDDDEAGEEAEEPEEIELNFGGEKLRVPKGAIPEEVATKVQELSTSLEAGYTKKFQDVAERSKSVEAREQAVDKLQGLNGEVLQSYSRGMQIKGELERLASVDVDALWQSNPDQARQLTDRRAQLQSEFQNVVQEVSQKEGELSAAQEGEISRRRDEGKAILEKRIPGFSERVPEVIDYVVKTYGIPKEAAEKDWSLNPVTAEMAHKAMLYDRAQTVKSPKPKKKQATPVPPMKSKGNTKGARDLVNGSVGDMAKHLGLPG